MTRWNHYAVDFQKSGQEIINEYIAAKDAYASAEAARSDLETRFMHGELMGDTDAEMRLLKARKAEEEAFASFNDVKAACKRKADALIEDTRGKLEASLNDFYDVDGDKYDSVFADMLESGAIDDGAIARAFDRFADNGTMLAVVSNAVRKGRGGREAAKRLAEYDASNSKAAVMRKFDILASRFKQFVASEWSPYWGKQSAEYVEGF